MTAVAPASMATSRPSANGKNASDATTEPFASVSGSVRADGTIGVRNRCRTADGSWKQVFGTATPQKPGSTDAFWVRFDNWPTRLLPDLVRGDYRVLYVDPDYQMALVGNSDRDYLWILARQTSLPEATLRRLLAEANRNGYDTSDMIWRSKDSAIAGK